jgi:hypothetical protein
MLGTELRFLAGPVRYQLTQGDTDSQQLELYQLTQKFAKLCGYITRTTLTAALFTSVQTGKFRKIKESRQRYLSNNQCLQAC